MARGIGLVEQASYNGSSFYCDDCRASLDFVTTSLELERTFEDGRRAGVPIQEP